MCDVRVIEYFLQQVSIEIQRGNAATIVSTAKNIRAITRDSSCYRFFFSPTLYIYPQSKNNMKDPNVYYISDSPYHATGEACAAGVVGFRGLCNCHRT